MQAGSPDKRLPSSSAFDHFFLLTDAEVMACLPIFRPFRYTFQGFGLFRYTFHGFGSFVTLSKVLVALSFRLFTQLSLFLQRLIFCDMKYWQCLFIYFLAWQYPFQFPINLFHASPDLTYCRKKVVKLHHKHSISGQ